MAWYLDVRELRVSKAIVARPKDCEFSRALWSAGLVDADTFAGARTPWPGWSRNCVSAANPLLVNRPNSDRGR